MDTRAWYFQLCDGPAPRTMTTLREETRPITRHAEQPVRYVFVLHPSSDPTRYRTLGQALGRAVSVVEFKRRAVRLHPLVAGVDVLRL
jgi:hypothetical protein